MKKIYLFTLVCVFCMFLFSCSRDTAYSGVAIDEDAHNNAEVILSETISFDAIPMQSIDEAIRLADYVAKVRILERSDTRLLGGYTLDDLMSLLYEPWTRDAYGPMSGIVTPYQIEIIDVYQGDVQPGEILTLIKNYGIYHGFEHIVYGQASYTEGEYYILFLRRTHIGPYVFTLDDSQTTIPVSVSDARGFSAESLSEKVSILNKYAFNLLFYDCYTIDDIINRINEGVERNR